MSLMRKHISLINFADIQNLNVQSLSNDLTQISNFLQQVTFWAFIEKLDSFSTIKKSYDKAPPQFITQAQLNVSGDVIKGNSFNFSLSDGSPLSKIKTTRMNRELETLSQHFSNIVNLRDQDETKKLSVDFTQSLSENYETNKSHLNYGLDLTSSLTHRGQALMDITSRKQYNEIKDSDFLKKIENFYLFGKEHLFQIIAGELIFEMLKESPDSTVKINFCDHSEAFISSNDNKVNQLFLEHVTKLEDPVLSHYIYRSLLVSDKNRYNKTNIHKLPGDNLMLSRRWKTRQEEFDILMEKRSLMEIITPIEGSPKNKKIKRI